MSGSSMTAAAKLCADLPAYIKLSSPRHVFWNHTWPVQSALALLTLLTFKKAFPSERILRMKIMHCSGFVFNLLLTSLSALMSSKWIASCRKRKIKLISMSGIDRCHLRLVLIPAEHGSSCTENTLNTHIAKVSFHSRLHFLTRSTLTLKQLQPKGILDRSSKRYSMRRAPSVSRSICWLSLLFLSLYWQPISFCVPPRVNSQTHIPVRRGHRAVENSWKSDAPVIRKIKRVWKVRESDWCAQRKGEGVWEWPWGNTLDTYRQGVCLVSATALYAISGGQKVAALNTRAWSGL